MFRHAWGMFALYALCVLSAPAGETVTFNKDVAPILFQNCAVCHHAGEVAPFALMTYQDAAKRAKQIVRVTRERLMPPWKAEAGQHAFVGEKRLSDAQLATLKAWLEAGTPEGRAADLPPPPVFAKGWQLGEPTLVAKMAEPYTLRADGKDDYRCFVVPLNLSEDVYLDTFEFRSGNSRIVHHAILSVDDSGEARRLDAADPGVGYKSFGATGTKSGWGGVIGVWTPGMLPTHLPDGIGVRIKKGSDLVIQIHYHPSGKEEQDQSTVGLHLLPAKPSRLAHYTFFHQPRIAIPPGETHHRVTAEQKIPIAGVLLAILPHMHLIGTEMTVSVALPDGVEQTLIKINNWDFNWQNQYVYKKPVLLPAGSTAKLEAYFDNSAENPANPSNPPKWVRFGEQTTNEMAGCIVLVAAATAADAPDLKVKPETLAQYVGRYNFGAMTLTVKKQAEGRLVAEAAGKRVQLFASTPTTFQSVPDEGTLSFKTDEKGAVLGCSLFRMGIEMKGVRVAE
jgi:mono/diheme cytochrome c family protein